MKKVADIRYCPKPDKNLHVKYSLCGEWVSDGTWLTRVGLVSLSKRHKVNTDTKFNAQSLLGNGTPSWVQRQGVYVTTESVEVVRFESIDNSLVVYVKRSISDAFGIIAAQASKYCLRVGDSVLVSTYNISCGEAMQLKQIK